MNLSYEEARLLRLLLRAQYQGYRLVQSVQTRRWLLLSESGPLHSFADEHAVWQWLDRVLCCQRRCRLCQPGACYVVA